MGRPGKFRKKPIEVEAMQWDGTAAGATPIIDWVLSNDGTARYHDNRYIPSLSQIAVDTIEGTMYGDRDWWVIRGVEGEFYPCKPSIFDATYEQVSDG